MQNRCQASLFLLFFFCVFFGFACPGWLTTYMSTFTLSPTIWLIWKSFLQQVSFTSGTVAEHDTVFRDCLCWGAGLWKGGETDYAWHGKAWRGDAHRNKTKHINATIKLPPPLFKRVHHGSCAILIEKMKTKQFSLVAFPRMWQWRHCASSKKWLEWHTVSNSKRNGKNLKLIIEICRLHIYIKLGTRIDQSGQLWSSGPCLSILRE